jgi:hypothetical protein
MHVHQMPVLPEPPQRRPVPPKNSETARLRAEFEEVSGLIEERHREKDRQSSRRDASPDRNAETGPATPGSSAARFEAAPERVEAAGGLDLLV